MQLKKAAIYATIKSRKKEIVYFSRTEGRIKMNEFELIAEKTKKLGENETLKAERKLPSNAYFLSEDEIVCYPRKFGDSRYPYACDGLTLWAYSSGNIKIEESNFSVNVDFPSGESPKIAFWFGIEKENGFQPVAITGAGKSETEQNVDRCCVYSEKGAYYLAKTENLIGGVKTYIDENKQILFTLWLKNTSDRKTKTYLSSYYNLLLRHAEYEGFEDKWYRKGEVTKDGYKLSVIEYINRLTSFHHVATIQRVYTGKVYATTSPLSFKGNQHSSIAAADALKTGVIEGPKQITNFTESAVSADIIPLSLAAGEQVEITYTICLAEKAGTDKQVKEEFLSTYQNLPKMEFSGNNFGIGDFAYNAFLKNVMKQVEFCARAKNYAGALIGVRDVFQQVQAAIFWVPEYARKKLVEVLNFIGEDGRAPRQYSYPKTPDSLPEMDLREYIDQGLWVISTFYTYLSFTGDYSVLQEECGYYKFVDGKVEFSSRRDSALQHLLAITDFLISSIDRQTGCLRILYGDWNDAVDGLGRTTDKGEKFGSGVSVMATMQLYQSLGEMTGILEKIGGYSKRAENYKKVRENVAKSVEKYAIVSSGSEKKIIHGWGDKMAYKIGSFCDNDGLSRDSATSNAFFALSGLIKKYPYMKEHILSAYDRLDSKYGLKTFQPAFAPTNLEVGRIVRLPEGTAENGAAYNHSTAFAIWSLFEMGEDERAWAIMKKLLPLTHSFISTTPFVMSNSYLENLSLGLDGESMNDWFTGSGCVLVKVLFFCVFGLKADLKGITIQPAKVIPFDAFSAQFTLKGSKVNLTYKNQHSAARKYFLNGQEVSSVVVGDNLKGTLNIEVVD